MTKDSDNSLEIFKDNVYSVILDRWLEPKEAKHLSDIAKKHGIPQDDARKIIDECLKEKGAKRGKPKPSNLPPEMEHKNYYELLGISEKASAKQIEEAYKKQFNTWHTHTNNPHYRRYVDPAKKLLLEARGTLLDNNRRNQYDKKLREKDLEDETTFSPGAIPGVPILEVNKDSFSFQKVRLGAVRSETITINNIGGGLLSGSIKTSVPWLNVSPNKIDTGKHRQEIAFTIDTTGLAFGNNYSGVVEIQSNAGRPKEISVSLSTEVDEADLSRFMKSFTVGGLILGAVFGYFIYNLSLIHGMNVNVAGIAGIVALVGGVIAAGKLLGFGWGCGTLIGGLIILASLEKYPQALSTVAWAGAYGSLANMLSRLVRGALWRANRSIPIAAGVGVLALTALIIIGGFEATKQDRESGLARSKAAQRTIQTTRSKLIGEWHGKIDRNNAKLFITRTSKQLSGKMVYEGIEENLSIDLKNNDGKIDIVLKGTSYKRLKGRGRFCLDTFYGKLSSDGRHIKGNYIDAAKRKGKWSVSKVASMLGAGRLFVKTEPAGARIRVLNIGPKFYQGMKLKPGRYHVEVSAVEYKTQKKWIKLESKEDRRIFVSMMKMKK